MKKYDLQRKDVSSWDSVFMAISSVVEERCKDPSTQVAACIVGEDNRIISVGYNGTPNGFKDEYFPWAREGEELEKKYIYVVHAERNAILNYRGNNKVFQGAKLYVTLFPCNECAKEIIQVGIKEVIYDMDKYADTDAVKASKRMFDACGVKYREISDDVREERNQIFRKKVKQL